MANMFETTNQRKPKASSHEAEAINVPIAKLRID